MNKYRKTMMAVVPMAFLCLAVSTALANDVTWNVPGDGVWDKVTANWTGDATVFADGDDVTFDNVAGGTITVKDMSPAKTTVNNESGEYIFVSGDAPVGSPSILTGTLVKDGAGTLQLGASNLNPHWGDGNNYSNGFTSVTVNGGTLEYGNHDAFGTGMVTMAGGTTLIQIANEGRYSNNEDVSNLFVLSGGNVEMPMAFGGKKDIWLSGVVSGPGGINVTGSTRSLSLSAKNTFEGGVDFQGSNCRLQIGSYTALGTGTLTVGQTTSTGTGGGLLAVEPLGGDAEYPDGVTNAIEILAEKYFNISGENSSDTLLLSGVISGTGTLRKHRNTSTVTLSGLNTYTGGTIVDNGTLTIEGSVADSDMTINTGTLNGSGLLNFNIDGTENDLIEIINGGTLDITNLNIDFNTSNLTEEVYILVDSAVVADPPVTAGILVGTEFASVGEVPGYSIEYGYGGGTQIALVQGIDADINGDGQVDGADLNLLLSNYDAGGPGGGGASGYNSENLDFLLSQYGRPPAGAAEVPEPCSALLLLLGLFGIASIGRRRG